MKATMINKTHIEGLLYEHDLALKTSGPNSKTPGTEFISGTVSIATDNACVNVVPVHFTYVTATTTKGGVNATFTTLKNITCSGAPQSCVTRRHTIISSVIRHNGARLVLKHRKGRDYIKNHVLAT